MSRLPATELELVVFLRAFEMGTLPKSAWSHAAHIFTGACMVHTLGEEAALGYMRDAIRRYNVAVGGQNTATSGYHETVTVLWMKLLGAHLRETQPASRLAFAMDAVAHFAGQRDLFRRLYDFDVLASTEARQSWVAPNLQSIE